METLLQALECLLEELAVKTYQAKSARSVCVIAFSQSFCSGPCRTKRLCTVYSGLVLGG